MPNIYGKGFKAKATKLHSIIIRSQGRCESCGFECNCTDKFKHTVCPMQAAHIEGRKASATRTLLINAYNLCASCHARYTDKPLTFSRFVTTTWAQEYREQLLKMSNTMTKVNWADRYKELKALEARLKQGETLEDLKREEAVNL